MTPAHLAIVMEYAAGGELFERICNAGRFSEDEVRLGYLLLFSAIKIWFSVFFAILSFYMKLFVTVFVLQARFFFQQLISGVSYCHSMVRIAFVFLCYDL